MPSKLEMEGKVRRVKAIAYAAFTPDGPMDRFHFELAAGGEEVLQDVVVSAPFQVTDKEGVTRTGTKRVYETRWVPETISRHFLKGIPEPLYQPEDLERFRAYPFFTILRPGREVKEFRRLRKEEAARELAIGQAKRLERERRLVREREIFLARIQNREEPEEA